MILVDGHAYKNKAQALAFFMDAMLACEGSERERMAFAYVSVKEGYKNIDTYNETAK